MKAWQPCCKPSYVIQYSIFHLKLTGPISQYATDLMLTVLTFYEGAVFGVFVDDNKIATSINPFEYPTVNKTLSNAGLNWTAIASDINSFVYVALNVSVTKNMTAVDTRFMILNYISQETLAIFQKVLSVRAFSRTHRL